MRYIKEVCISSDTPEITFYEISKLYTVYIFFIIGVFCYCRFLFSSTVHHLLMLGDSLFTFFYFSMMDFLCLNTKTLSAAGLWLYCLHWGGFSKEVDFQWNRSRWLKCDHFYFTIKIQCISSGTSCNLTSIPEIRKFMLIPEIPTMPKTQRKMHNST